MNNLERLLRKHLKYAFIYRHIVGRVAKNYCRLLIGRKALRGIEFALTYECNCHCEHCSAASLHDSSRRPLSPSEMRETISQCLDLGALNINLTGGEVLMRDDIDELVHAARPDKAVVSLATNGILLDRTRAERLHSLGVRIITISLDSADQAEHDGRRGHLGCYRKVFEAVDNARDAGMEVFLCTILTPANLKNGDIWKMIELSRERRLTLTVNLSCPVGRWAGRKDLLLDEAMLKEFEEITALPHVRWEGGSNYLREGCPAGVEKLYISPYGDVMPCPFAHIAFGNVREEPLREIWGRMTGTPPFDRIHSRCLIGGDERFRDRVLPHLGADRQLPLREHEHPAFSSPESVDEKKLH